VSGLALVLLVVFGLVTLVLRVVLQLLLTGSTGIKGISGRPGSLEWSAGVLFLCAIALTVAGAVLADRGTLEPIDALDGRAGHVAGAVLAIGGIAATAAAQLAMGEAWRIGVDPGERTRLVTGGPFAIVRNPIYAGMIPCLAGIALLVPTVLTIAGALLILLALELQTRLVEEPHLRRTHGDVYVEYAARVGRFLPGTGRLRR
jgi:protein-S-isoprenylcysteine O-methyltransferase Ste14